MSNELDHLLAQCDQVIPIDATDRAWLNGEAVGHEMLDEHFVVPVIADPERFIDQLRNSLTAIDRLGQPLEIADLANEIGLLLGRAISDKAALERDFLRGFAHGVDLARRAEVCD